MGLICEVCGQVAEREEQVPEDNNAMVNRHILHVCEDCQQNLRQDR